MKRIKYYDLLRVVCFCFIIFYHMMVQLTINGIYPNEKISTFYSNVNMHIATLAVAVFLCSQEPAFPIPPKIILI